MSYSVTVQDHVTLSTTVSYGASEHGGSKHVTLTEPIYITVTVDDEVFNSSVGSCDRRLMDVNSTLSDSIRAQSEAKMESARKISTSVMDGFYKYAATDFRQQLVQLENEINASVPKIQSYMEQLKGIKQRMESDYNLISSRYVKIIQTFDDELERELHRLYGPCFELFEDCQNKLIVGNNTSSQASTIGFEDISVTQALMVQARLKDVLLNVQKALAGYAYARISLDRLIGEVAEKRALQQNEVIHLPVLLFESEKDGRMQTEVCSAAETFSNAVRTRVIENSQMIGNSERDDELMDMEFMKLLSAVKDEKKAKKILSLYEGYKRRRA